MRPNLVLALLLAFCFAKAPEPARPQTPPATDGRLNPANQGLIYGAITWPDGRRQEGFLRWDREEATWDDLFHTGYRENPWHEFIDHEALRRERREEFYANNGLLRRLLYALDEDDQPDGLWRMLEIRFGDIAFIEIRDGKDDFLTTADGGRHQIGGYANDDGSDLWFYEQGAEPVKIEWNDLVRIEFRPAPPDHEPFARRLYGTVESTAGTFTGPIMWDKSECLDTDILDGENDEGDLELPMGRIRSIAKKDGRSVTIVTSDGRTFPMWGSNDVDAGNRGVWILTPDTGWVCISWKRFRKVTFSEAPDSGTPRAHFDHGRPLRGAVLLEDGSRVSGRLVYDLDEGFAWDIFNGEIEGIDYDIPFGLIARIERVDEKTCRVHLRSGRVLELSGNQDTGERHGGVLVFEGEGKSARHLAWREIEAVVLDAI